MAVNKQSAPAQVETVTIWSRASMDMSRARIIFCLVWTLTDEFSPVSHTEDVRVFENVEPDQQRDHHDGDRISQELIGEREIRTW